MARYRITGGDWTNTGILAATDNLQIQAERLANPGALLFSGADMTLHIAHLLNPTGEIQSGANLRIAKDAAGAPSDNVDNRSGTIESAGNLTILARLLDSVRETLDIVTHKLSAQLIDTDCSGGSACGGTNKNTTYTLREIDRTEVLAASAPSWLLAGGDMTLMGGALENRSSVIAAAGNLHIVGDTFANRGVQVGDILTERHLRSPLMESRRPMNRAADRFNNQYANNGPHDNAAVDAALNAFLYTYIDYQRPMGDPVFTPAEGAGAYNGVVQAGGAILIEAEETAQSVLRPYSSFTSGGQTEDGSLATPLAFNAQLPPDLAHKLTETAGPALGALFRKAPPDHPYLIETNARFTDLFSFLSSNHLLDRLGIDPDTLQRRLGDGAYEQRLVREALLARTGQRFLEGYTSDAAQYQALMDNAAAAQ
ncbi:MAG: hypothetical protein LBL48_02275, partial [Azoarcus sp.]|nr:hypothetical protein [Azoarcus sp.]